MKFLYRSSFDGSITKEVVFAGLTSTGKPQGRTYNARGHDLGVKELSAAEAREFRRLPNQVIEMGVFDPYESVYDQLRRLNHRRRLAPPRRSGRGTNLKNAMVVEIMTGLMRGGGKLRTAMGKGLF